MPDPRASESSRVGGGGGAFVARRLVSIETCQPCFDLFRMLFGLRSLLLWPALAVSDVAVFARLERGHWRWPSSSMAPP